MKQNNRSMGMLRTGIALLTSILLTGFCAAMAAPGLVWAEEESESTNTFDDGTLTYTILNSTDVAVTACSDAATHVSIMPKIDGYNIVSIGEEAFAQCSSLQAITIPTSVTEIGDAAFYGCTSLTSMTIPDSVTEIPAGCFFNCTALTDLTLGNDTVSIGDMAFGYCTSLKEVTLPESVETLGDQVFYYCIALETAEIPKNVTALGNYTFYGCMGMTEFVIPATLEDIGAMTFIGCQSLETILVQDGNPNYTVQDNTLYNTDRTILYLYPAGRTDAGFSIPDGTLVIYAGAFFSATHLEQVTFNDDLQYIGEMAFEFCTSLDSVTIPETVTTIGTTAFSDCTALSSVTFAGADEEDGGEGDALEIGDYAFFCCDALSEVRLPKRVSAIGDYAFGCTSPEEDAEVDEDDVITVNSDSGTTLEIIAVDGFVLRGFTGAASDYVDNCEVKVNFDSINFNWTAFLFYAGVAVVIVVVVFVAVRIVKHNMLTAEERARRKELAEKQAEKDRPDDGYRGILEETDAEDDEATEQVASYEQTLTHASLHQIGHASAVEDDTKSAADPEEQTKE